MPSIRVVLVEPYYEINVGYVARVMKNFGFTELYLVKPRAQINEVARRYAMKGRDVLEKAVILDSIDSAIKDVELVVGTTGKISDTSLLRQTLSVRDFAERARSINGTVAILFGREPSGLTNEEIKLCDYMVTIPANPEYPILNLSHAVAIVLYEIFMAIKGKKMMETKIPRDYATLILDYISKICENIEFHDLKKDNIILAFKKIIYKSNPTEKELRTILLFMRKIYVLLCKSSF